MSDEGRVMAVMDGWSGREQRRRDKREGRVTA